MERFNVIKKREFVKDKNAIREFRLEILCLSDFEIKSIVVRRELEDKVKCIISDTNKDYLDKIYVTENPDHSPLTVILMGYNRSDYRYREMKVQLFQQTIEIDKDLLEEQIWKIVSQTNIRCYYLLMNAFTRNELADEGFVEINKEYGIQDFYKYKDRKIPVIVVRDSALEYGEVEVTYNKEEKNLIAERSFREK